MEVTATGAHTRFPIDHASRVGEARRFAAELAAASGCGEVAAGRLALVVTELGTNLLRHARQGELLLAQSPGRDAVEVIAWDHGPGIADLGRSLGDGYSTGGTPGTGLGAVRRLADDFDIHTNVPGGTVVVARVRAQPEAATRSGERMRFTGIAFNAPGERVCGDAWAAHVDGGRAALLLADGLGHGPDAAEAAQAAVAAFQQAPMETPALQLQRIHARLRSTRGAAVSLYQADADSATIRYAGAGNVIGRLVSGLADKTLLVQHGTAGLQIRTPEEVTVAWPPHALLVAHSDGVESRWNAGLLVPALRQDPAMPAALLLRAHCRGRDDATVVVLRRNE